MRRSPAPDRFSQKSFLSSSASRGLIPIPQTTRQNTNFGRFIPNADESRGMDYTELDILSTLQSLKASKDMEHAKPIEKSPRYLKSVYQNSGTTSLSTVRYGAKEPPHKYVVNNLDNYQARVPLQLENLNSIFEIFGVGYAYYNQEQGTRASKGCGFLISENTALTLNTIIPDETSARNNFFRFPDDPYHTHQFSTTIAFHTNAFLNFTVIGVTFNSESKRQRKPIPLKEKFILQENSVFLFKNVGAIAKKVQKVEDNFFKYTEGWYIAPGMPIFSNTFKLQGVHHTMTAQYNLGTRIDAINFYLQQMNKGEDEPFTLDEENSEIPTLPRQKTFSHLRKAKPMLSQRRKSSTSSPNEYLYWLEWGARKIWRFETIQTNSQWWEEVEINNLGSFLAGESTDWFINWGCRIVFIPDKSFFIIGGSGNELSDVKSDVYHFFPDTGQILRKKSMIEPRDAPALVYRQGHIYAIGGKYSYKTWEFYEEENDTWTQFGSLMHGRHGSTAILQKAEKFIYLVGGFPLETSSTLIERFSFETEVWELVHIKLPIAAINNAIFAVSDDSFAILGGKYSNSTFLIEIQERQSGCMMKEEMTLAEMEGFPHNFETVYPVVYVPETKLLYILRGSSGAHDPRVLSYRYSKFFESPQKQPFHFNRMFQVPKAHIIRDTIMNADFSPKYVIDY